MGGQLEFFGLWIDQEFDVGHSKAGARGNTTYGSPQLSAETEFTVNSMEVWQVGKVKREGDEDEDEGLEDDDDDVDQVGVILLCYQKGSSQIKLHLADFLFRLSAT